MTKSILADKLKSFDYYVQKCPLYLQNCPNFIEHFRIWYDMLVGSNSDNGIIGTADTLLQYLDIFTTSAEVANYPIKAFDVLQKLGSLFGIKPVFKYEGTQFRLTQSDFLMLLKATIIKNNSSGTYEEMQELYRSIGLNIAFKYTSPASVTVYLLYLPHKYYSNPVTGMFKKGLLTIKSMGIEYEYVVQEYTEKMFLVWDESKWDKGVWVA